MATTIGSIANVLREELAPGIRESLADIDEIFKNIVSTDMGVERDGLGRTWQFIHTFETGLSGGYKIRSAAGPNVVGGLNNVTMFGTPQGYPSQAEVTSAAYLQKTITLKEGAGSLSLPHQYLRADQLNAAIGSAVRAELRGTAKKIAHTHAIHFYLDDVTNFAIADVGDISATGTNNGTTAVTVDFGGTNAVSPIRRFYPGMLVDVWNSAGTVQNNIGFNVVTDELEPLADKVTFRTVDGTSLLTFADDDVIVFKDSQGTGFSGLNSWIKSSGTIFGINTANFPHFRSHIPAAIGAALTEPVLNKHWARFLDAYGSSMKLDTIITTPGVTIGYLDNLSSTGAANEVGRWNRSGEPLEVSAGWGGFNYVYNGQPMRWLISSYVQRKVLYGIKLGENNLKRFVPPAIPGTTSESGFDGSVEFIAPLGGSNGPFLHSRLPSGAVGDNVEAPFAVVQEFAPEYVQSIKLTGITESLG